MRKPIPIWCSAIVDDGHDVGNHTFTHPNLRNTPNAVVSLEINATQRLFEALTGRSMRLFRPPYLGDAEPTDADEIVPIEDGAGHGLYYRRHCMSTRWTGSCPAPTRSSAA